MLSNRVQVDNTWTVEERRTTRSSADNNRLGAAANFASYFLTLNAVLSD
jgi:hypothetical protein